MHQHDRRRAFGGRLLVLVRPAAIVRHGLATKHRGIELRAVARVGHRRIANEHHDYFAAHVDSFDVIPAILGRFNTIANEDYLTRRDRYE